MQFLKRAILFSLQALFVMLVVVACTRDSVDDNNIVSGSVSEVVSKGNFYLAFKIHSSSDSFTRAESIEDSNSGDKWDGSDDEQIARKGNYLLLFTAAEIKDEEGNKTLFEAGQFHSCIPLAWNDQEYDDGEDKRGEHEHDDEPFEGAGPDDIGEAIYWAWFKDGESYFPKSCYCFVVLNAPEKVNKILSDKESKEYEALKALNIENLDPENIDKIDPAIRDIFVWTEKTNPENIGYSTDKDGRYFTMTNSVFYQDERIDQRGIDDAAKKEEDRDYIFKDKTETWQWQSSEHPAAVFVPDISLFIMPEQPTRTSNSITIYVERMVSKFSLTLKGREIDSESTKDEELIFYPDVDRYDNPVTNSRTNIVMFDGFVTAGSTDDGSGTGSTGSTGSNDNNSNVAAVGGLKLISVPWRVKVTGWGINGLERQSYMFKKITKGAQYFPDIAPAGYSYPSEHRSYWSEDLNFDNEPWFYPWQYRWAIDNFDGSTRQPFEYYKKEHDSDTQHDDNILKNYSFNALNLGGKTPDGGRDESTFNKTSSFNKVVYTPENTYDWDKYGVTRDKQLLDYRNELLACTHLLVGAELQIADTGKHICEDLKTEEANGTKYIIEHDWYRDRNGFFYRSERECFAALVHAFNQTLKSQSTMTFFPYDWENGGPAYGHEIVYKKDGDGKYILDENNKKIPEYEDAEKKFVKCNEVYLQRLVAEVGNKVNEDGSETWFQLCYRDKEVPIDRPGAYKLLTGQKVLDMSATDANGDDVFNATFGELVKATIRGGDGKLLPWPKDLEITIAKVTKQKGETNEDNYDVQATGLVYYYTTTDDYGNIVADDEYPKYKLDENPNLRLYFRQSLFYEWVGAIDHYNKGKMYYSHGIDNPLGAYETAPERYGVVRNNWYQFNINGITSMGTPVDDPNQPIIPERVDQRDQINVSINILGWHEVESKIDGF